MCQSQNNIIWRVKNQDQISVWVEQTTISDWSLKTMVISYGGLVIETSLSSGDQGLVTGQLELRGSVIGHWDTGKLQ